MNKQELYELSLETLTAMMNLAMSRVMDAQRELDKAFGAAESQFDLVAPLDTLSNELIPLERLVNEMQRRMLK